MFDWFQAKTYFGHIAKREDGIRAYPKLKTWAQFLEETKWDGSTPAAPAK